MSKPVEPLRGDAAWKAAKKGVADRNEEAYARGRRDRAAKNTAFAAAPPRAGAPVRPGPAAQARPLTGARGTGRGSLP